MGHNPTQGGMSTDMRGAVLDVLAVSFGASGAPTLVDAGKTGLLDATTPVVKAATGRYTFQLSPNYYKSLVGVVPMLSAVTTTGAFQYARYLEASYNSSTGVFEVDVCSNTTTPALADPTQNSVLTLYLTFQRYAT